MPFDRSYIIEKILPSNEVSLLAGPSGAGKTTWLFQMLEEWHAGRPILGYQSFPCDWHYLSCDRSIATTLETVRRTRTNPAPERIHSMVSYNKYARSIDGLNKFMAEKMSNGGLLIIDGFASLVPQGKVNDYQTVSDMLVQLHRAIHHAKITIIGLTHNTKSREGEQILNPRQRVLGTVAWAGFTETVFLMEPVKEDDPANPERKLSILPRNAAEFSVRLVFDSNGRLIEADREVTNVILDAKLATSEPGKELAKLDIMAWASSGNVPPRSAERWITRMVADGKLERVQKGRYRVKFPV